MENSSEVKLQGKENIHDILSLTPQQEGMLFHYLKEPESDLYFERICLYITGRVDVQPAREAWQSVVDGNEMLRTVFRWGETRKSLQMILRYYPIDFIYHDLSHEKAAEKENPPHCSELRSQTTSVRNRHRKKACLT